MHDDAQKKQDTKGEIKREKKITAMMVISNELICACSCADNDAIYSADCNHIYTHTHILLPHELASPPDNIK